MSSMRLLLRLSPLSLSSRSSGVRLLIRFFPRSIKRKFSSREMLARSVTSELAQARTCSWSSLSIFCWRRVRGQCLFVLQNGVKGSLFGGSAADAGAGQ